MKLRKRLIGLDSPDFWLKAIFSFLAGQFQLTVSASSCRKTFLIGRQWVQNDRYTKLKRATNLFSFVYFPYSNLISFVNLVIKKTNLTKGGYQNFAIQSSLTKFTLLWGGLLTWTEEAVADPGEGPGGPVPPIIFRPKWDRAPLISGSGWPPPLLPIWRSGSATGKVRWVYMQKFWSDYPLNDPPPFLCGLYLVLGPS